MEQVKSKSNASRKELSNMLILRKNTIMKRKAALRSNNNFVVKGEAILQQCALIGMQLQKCIQGGCRFSRESPILLEDHGEGKTSTSVGVGISGICDNLCRTSWPYT